MNVGAADAVARDPLHQLIVRVLNHPKSWVVAFEADPVLCESHRRNLPKARLACATITPINAWPLLRQLLPAAFRGNSSHGGRIGVDVLKVDIDSFDCVLVEKLLRGDGQHSLRPRVLVLEVNEAIPPPLRFTQGFDPDFVGTFPSASLECGGNFPVVGCSLSYQVAMLYDYGYRLVYFSQANAVFADAEIVGHLQRAGGSVPLDEFSSYSGAFIGPGCVSSRQVRRWSHESTVAEARAEVWEHLRSFIRLFGLPQGLPMTLEV